MEAYKNVVESEPDQQLARIERKIAGLSVSFELSGQQEVLQRLKKKLSKQVRLLTAAFLLSTGSSSTPSKYYPELTSVASEAEDTVAQEKMKLKREHPVTRTFASDGSVVYQHWDSQTTELLNYFSGRGEVTDKMLSMCLRKGIAGAVTGMGKSMEDEAIRAAVYSIETKKEMLSFFATYYTYLPQQVKQEYKTPEAFANSVIDTNRSLENDIRSNFNPALYDALWNIFESVGAPRIELVDTESELLEGRESEPGGSSYFVEVDEDGLATIYLDAAYCTEDGIGVLIQEMSHADGSHNDKVSKDRRLEVENRIESEKIDELNRQTLLRHEAIENESYNIPGTEEYHAHKITFPKLMEKISPLLTQEISVVAGK